MLRRLRFLAAFVLVLPYTTALSLGVRNISEPLPPQLIPRQDSLRSKALSNMKQLAVGMLMYCSDYDDITPYAQDTKSAFAVTQPYLKNSSLFKSLNPSGSRIVYNLAVAGVFMTALENPAEMVLYYDQKPWPNGQHLAAFADGHVKFMSEEAWRRAAKSLRVKVKRKTKPLPPNYWKQINPRGDFGG